MKIKNKQLEEQYDKRFEQMMKIIKTRGLANSSKFIIGSNGPELAIKKPQETKTITEDDGCEDVEDDDEDEFNALDSQNTLNKGMMQVPTLSSNEGSKQSY